MIRVLAVLVIVDLVTFIVIGAAILLAWAGLQWLTAGSRLAPSGRVPMLGRRGWVARLA
jgi:hypothetical protein